MKTAISYDSEKREIKIVDVISWPTIRVFVNLIIKNDKDYQDLKGKRFSEEEKNEIMEKVYNSVKETKEEENEENHNDTYETIEDVLRECLDDYLIEIEDAPKKKRSKKKTNKSFWDEDPDDDDEDEDDLFGDDDDDWDENFDSDEEDSNW